MAGVNKVIIVGNLGRDPEMKYTHGSAIANFSVATSDQWNDKNTGEKRERTEWHRMVAFGKLAEICGQYLTKGKQIYAEGKIQTREWEDKDGNRRWTTEIVVQQMQMLGGRGDNGGDRRGGDPGYQGGYDHPPAQNRSGWQNRSGGYPAQQSFPDTPPPASSDDADIPF